MGASQQADPRWAFRVLGRFEAIRDGEPLAVADLGSRKQRRLLKLLLIERNRLVSTDRIVDALWDKPPARPERLVATLVSRLRGVFGRSLIQGGPDAYRFAHATVDVDLDEAERLADEAGRRARLGEPSLARAAAEGALALLERGQLLDDEPYAEWVEAARADAARLLRVARSIAWTSALETGDPEAAIALAERGLATDPLDEEAGRVAMLGHRAAGRRTHAISAYERLRTALSEELGVDPAPETRELHGDIVEETEAARPEAARPGPRPGKDAAGERPEPLDPAFVGRQAEIGLAADAWSAAAGGETTLVLLVGEAGMGKTTVGTRVASLARSTGGLVLEARCYEAERSLFLQPIADAIRPLVLRSSAATLRALNADGGVGLARLSPELSAAMGTPIPEPTIPELERRRAFDAAADLIRSLAGRQPVLLYLDDLHLAGAATVEFLHYLVRRAAPSRLLVLGSLRVEESDDVRRALGEMARTIEVGALPAEAVRRLAATMGTEDVGDDFVELTRGHPLFVVEMLRALAERPAPDVSGTRTPIPDTLRAAVLERVERAGQDVADLLGAAAIIGSTFDLGVVAALLDLPLEEAIRRGELAHRARLLVPVAAEFAFSNDLVHEIVYGASPLPVRSLRHRTAATLLAGRPELVARHAHAAGAWPEAAEAWLAAAVDATAHYANQDAELLLDRALGAAGRAGDLRLEAKARLARGRARETLGKYGEAVDDASAVATIARRIGDRVLEMEALRDMGGDPIVALGRTPADCVRNLEAALAIADDLGDRSTAIDILRRLAVIETNCLRGESARRYADTAVASARESGDELALAAALDGRKTVAAYVGDVATLEAVTDELRPILERRDLPWFLQWAVFESSIVPLARGEWAEAVARIDHALELNRRTGYHAYQPMFLAQRAWIEENRGQYGEALETALAASAMATETGHPWWSSFVASVLGRILLRIGAIDRATDVLAAGLEIADRDGTQLYVLRCLGPLAEATALRGDSVRARALAERVESLIPPMGPGPLFLHAADGPIGAGRAWLAIGEVDRAVAVLRQVADAADAAGWVEPRAAAALGLGLAHDTAGASLDARADLERAIEIAGESLPGISADAGAVLARHVRASGDSDAADRLAIRARDLYTTLASTLSPGEDRTRYELLVASRLDDAGAPLVVR